jgi:antitoxin component of RelBE/YafQ-DinJ toxin-antitoxin module
MTTAKEMKCMDEETRKKAQAIFERLGLTEEQAVELFYREMHPHLVRRAA